ncbi:protein yellow-like [Copidosoma floridanum]|uniref:protein yellow-like n=1 Tax=Copidosoma floridanum TaxID=29053 RepID=UPI0006C99F82|nr:protein yellow-like [Copidosoma floridanum]
MLLKHWMLLSLLYALTLAQKHPKVGFYWKSGINYTWPSYEVYQQADKDGSYVPLYNCLTNIRFWKDNAYLTIPRWTGGVAVTLATIPTTSINGNKAPLLRPYPNWEMQKMGGDCSSFQSVWFIEIDPMGRMWLMDNGWGYYNTTTDKVITCPPRLMILDLENGGEVLLNYSLPPNVAKPGSSVFCKILLDHEDGGFAYIYDCDEEDKSNAGLIIFSLQKLTSWRIEYDFKIKELMLSPADTEGSRVLYIVSSLEGNKVLGVPTRVLRSPSLASSIDGEARELSKTPFTWSDATTSNTGTVFFTVENSLSVYKWDLNSPRSNVTELDIKWTEDPNNLASLALDGGNLWAINIIIPEFQSIVLAETKNMVNYQYYGNGGVPKLPFITLKRGI